MLDSGENAPLRMIVGRSHYDLTEEYGNREAFLRLKSFFDGRHNVEQISLRTGLDVASIREIVSEFKRLGLLREENEKSFVNVEDISSKISDTLAMWRRQIGFHKLFQQLSSGAARQEVLCGLFIETYHVVNLASKHISVAIAHADSEKRRRMLSEYIVDEYNHSNLILDTCVNLGLNRKHVSDSHPTVGTISLVNMLCEIGRTDTLAYMASTSLFEAIPDDEQEGKSSIEAICAAYDIDADVFMPAFSHLKGDIEAEHSSFIDQALSDEKIIPTERLHSIVNLLHDLKHAFDQHHDQIMLYYSDISNYIPRPRVDYFSL